MLRPVSSAVDVTHLTIEDAKGAAVRAARRMLPSHACIAPVEWVNCEIPEIVRKFRTGSLLMTPQADAPSEGLQRMSDAGMPYCGQQFNLHSATKVGPERS
jgi:hypothetical protein